VRFILLSGYYGATGQVGYIDDYLTDGEYVILGEDGAPFLDHRKNKAYLINGRSWVNNHAHILKSYFDNKFLLFYLNSIDYSNYVSGTTRLKLTQGALAKIPFLLPPLPEQRAIVAKLEQLFSELDNGIACLKKAQEQLKVYRQAVLKQAFEGELTKAWREQQTSLPSAQELLENIKREREQAAKLQGKKLKPVVPLTQAELDGLPELPVGWKWVKLSDFNHILGGVTKGRKLVGKKTINLPYLRVANVQAGYLNLKEIKEITVLESDLDRYRLCFGDILYTEGGDKDKLGRGTVWRNQIENCIHQNHIFRARPISRNTVSEFVPYYSQTKSAKDYFYSNAKQTVNLASINLTVLSRLPFPYCSPQEQSQIVQEIETRLSVCDNIESTIRESLEKAEALRQSILKKAFEGKLLGEEELQITRNAPDWEPAEKLLERIRSEKRTARNKH